MIGDHILNHAQIHVVIATDEDVSEARHAAQRHRERCVDPSMTLEDVEQGVVGARFSEALVRHDVGGDIQGRVDRDLQRVLDKSLLALDATEKPRSDVLARVHRHRNHAPTALDAQMRAPLPGLDAPEGPKPAPKVLRGQEIRIAEWSQICLAW